MVLMFEFQCASTALAFVLQARRRFDLEVVQKECVVEVPKASESDVRSLNALAKLIGGSVPTPNRRLP